MGLVLGIVVVCLVAAACGPVVTTPTGYKPLITGLVDKGSEGPYHQGVPYGVVDLTQAAAHSPGIAGVVVNQNWSQLEPSPGTFDFTSLDASLAAITTYNGQHPDAPLAARLRVFAAYAAPDWAKSLDGTPITIPMTDSNTGGTLGQWWKPNYRAAWAGLQLALATRYDTNPVLHEVVVSSCSSLTAEPFVIGGIVVPIVKAIGWTPALQQACLDGALTDYAPWTHTALYYPMNPLAGDQTITTEVMQRCAGSAAAGGPWCVLANNALSPVAGTTGAVAPTYAEMQTLWTANSAGTPIAFQMNSPTNSLYCASIAVAVTYHAQSVELWPAVGGQQPGYTTIPTSTLVAWSSALRNGTQPTC